MPRYSITGPLGEEAIVYGLVAADSALEALALIHREGLGLGAVRLINGELVFTDSSDQALCCGVWRVTQERGRAVEILIAPPEQAAA